MAFTQETFPFALPFGAPSGNFTASININCADPGVILLGTETGAVEAALYEYQGNVWLVTNAELVSGAWTQPNATISSYALVLSGSNGNVSQMFANPGGLPSPGWQNSVSTISSGYININGLYIQWGNDTIASDGSSAATVPFNTSFPTGCFGVWIQPDFTYQSTPYTITCAVNPSPSTTQFVVNASGAPTGSTVNVFWFALGH